jgi:nicotinate phosphoribosyltransferase
LSPSRGGIRNRLSRQPAQSFRPTDPNDFRELVPDDALAPFSLVCKAVRANGVPTVKLSDNPNKAMGPQDQIDRYKRVFNLGEQDAQEVVV